MKQNKALLGYITNSIWMISEYIFKIIAAIFVTIYVARYLGPDLFGTLSYALAIVTIFMAISRLGMESILVRDLSKYPERAQEYMGTAFGLMLIAAVVLFMILSSLIYFFESDRLTQVYIWIIAASLFFQTMLVVDYGFQSRVKAKFSSIAKTIALAISSAVKIYLVWAQADLLAFAISYLFDAFIVAIALVMMNLSQKEEQFRFSFDKSLVRPLLSSAWPMILSATGIMLYMRIDQIMIKSMLDTHQLGLYSAATRIYDGWIIIPYVISVSLIPAIVRLKSGSRERYEYNMTKLMSLVFWLGMFVAIVMTIAGGEIIRLTFGEEFVESETVLIIVMWTAAFTALGSISARYLTIEGMEKKIAVRTFVALVLNIVLNLVLIPLYGIEGAAIATLVTIVAANYLINYVDHELKQLVRISNDAITFKFIFMKGKK